MKKEKKISCSLGVVAEPCSVLQFCVLRLCCISLISRRQVPSENEENNFTGKQSFSEIALSLLKLPICFQKNSFILEKFSKSLINF